MGQSDPPRNNFTNHVVYVAGPLPACGQGCPQSNLWKAMSAKLPVSTMILNPTFSSLLA
jgi:hypothetical protein